MTMFDPLEPLRRSLHEITTWLGQEKYLLELMKRTGKPPDEKILGEIGALYAQVDDLRRANQTMLQQFLTEGEVELRRSMDNVLDQLIDILKDFRSY